MASESQAEAELKAKYANQKAEQDAKWQHEIELLETRVQTNFKDISIDDNGGTIAIKASLSDGDIGKITKLDQKRSKLGTRDEEGNLILTDEEIDEANEIAWEVLGVITANPVMTKEWFTRNRDKYSTEDMMNVTVGYYDGMAERMRRVSEVKEFRNKPTRR